MILLTILLALAIAYRWAPLASIQSDAWFIAWLQRVASWAAVDKAPAGRLVLSLALPIVGLVLLLDLLASISTLLLWAINLWVLLYSLGRGDLRFELKTLTGDLQRGDNQAAFHMGKELSADKSEVKAFDLPALAKELRLRVAYTYFERYLAVVFWCLVGGVAWALLYRLSVVYRAHLLQSEPVLTEPERHSELRVVSRWLALLEWLPLGLTGFTLTLVGRFGAGLSSWIKRWFSGRSSQQVLQDYVDEALDSPVDTGLISCPDIAASCYEIERLFRRVLVCWLCFLALVLVL